MTFAEYQQAVFTGFYEVQGEQRMGQFLVNELHKVRPDLCRKISIGLVVDPYYDDEKIPAFWAYVAEHWDD